MAVTIIYDSTTNYTMYPSRHEYSHPRIVYFYSITIALFKYIILAAVAARVKLFVLNKHPLDKIQTIINNSILI